VEDGSYVEYAEVPLENIHPLNEDLLTNQMRYTFQDLMYIETLAIPFGDIDVKPGETVLQRGLMEQQQSRRPSVWALVSLQLRGTSQS